MPFALTLGGVTFLLAVIWGSPFIEMMRRLRLGKNIRVEGPESHRVKAGTPAMGGLLIVGWTMVLLASIFVWRLINSPWGRVVKAIREDEDAARALGKNVFGYKLQSLIIGGVIGALAGILRTWDSGFVQSEQFRPQTTFFIWTVLILGGAASKWGPVLGAAIFWFVLLFVEELIRQMVGNEWIPEWFIDSTDIGRVRLIMMGLMLASLMIWRPQGILGKREEALLDAR